MKNFVRKHSGAIFKPGGLNTSTCAKLAGFCVGTELLVSVVVHIADIPSVSAPLRFFLRKISPDAAYSAFGNWLARGV